MKTTRKLILTALFVALGILLPISFHMVGLGKVFLPMHIPVILGGMLVGPEVGLAVGAVTPMLSALLTGMPPLMPPVAQGMVFELAIYGGLAGLLYSRFRLNPFFVVTIVALAGRLAYGTVAYLVLPLFGISRVPILYPITAGLVSGLPGVLLQVVLIPGLVYLVEKSHALRYVRGENAR
ncbi:MAG: ECF transporter S component [Bacillota bacterium]